MSRLNVLLLRRMALVALPMIVGCAGDDKSSSPNTGQMQQALTCGGGGGGGVPNPNEIPSGSLVIDLGVAPQTSGNGLKPYGLVFDLVKNGQIPVTWVINPAKTSNTDVDFTVDGRSFVGSAFIIPAPYVAAAQAKINLWKSKGVVVYGPTVASATVPTFKILTGFSNVLLDAQTGKIAQAYLTEAGLPAFPLGAPSALNSCTDMFAMPHADPTFAIHGVLKSYVTNGGFLWSGCHAVSVLENVDGPDAGTAPDLNFLSTAGLIPFGSHVAAVPPYS
jgi:hypothetical protein